MAKSRFASMGLVSRRWRAPALVAPYDLAGGVQVVPAPSWLWRGHLSNSPLTGEQLRFLANGPAFALQTEYEANWYRDEDPTWRGRGKRPYLHSAINKLIVANVAAWLAQPSALGYEWIVTAELDEGTGLWMWEHLARHSPLVPLGPDIGVRTTLGDLDRARDLNSIISAIDLDSPVMAALSALWSALTNTRGEIRYSMLWIALEALFASGGGGESTYRLCERMAMFLAGARGDRSKAKELFDQATADYIERSNIVHGLRKTDLKPEVVGKLMARAEGWVRESLSYILTTAGSVDQFSKKRRDKHLNGLVFDSGVPASPTT